ncbi:MAG: PKD domain-containing protein [Hamadaea sp.]|uniref:PQQ-dependent sugar dehydrogenase n=1 Tax=Hamadaea sp. TaxID=2024425 RepID=UPI0017F4E0C9|nr:PQQ-dependent sugar dehydrogenase [Hamadaea sp.]NUR70138.1 PKD domain-containing protein [Hamadaea sp.]NUT23624.1 PKD domain-containing protein [Hamadaea sp.]
MLGGISRARRFVRAAVATALVAAAFAPLRGPSVAQAASLPSGFQEQIVFSGLAQPTNIEFAPDGRVFVTEKAGVIKVFDDLSDTTPTVFADLSAEVHSQWDRGLLGIAMPPDFPSNPYLYVLYTYGKPLGGTTTWDDLCTGAKNGANGGYCIVSARLSRLQANGNTMVPGSEQVLINDWCQQYPSHSIGDLHFGPDGKLYVSAGDGASFNAADYGQLPTAAPNPCGDPAKEGGALRAQDIVTSGDSTGLDGTILRLDPATGAAAAGNPNIGSADPNTRRIIANGMRNSYRFTFRPGTSEIWAGDVGWSTWEEINRVVNPTATTTNFGWPCYEGAAASSYMSADLPICNSMTNPVGPYYTYNHAYDIVPNEGCSTGGDAITGLAFYPASGGSYPAAYGGALFFTDVSRNCIWAMKPASPGGLPATGNIELFAKDVSLPVDLAVGPGGELYYVDLGSTTGGNTGTVRRIRYYAGNQPPAAVVEATPTSGKAPLTVAFNGANSTDNDPADQGRLTYAWDFTNNGSTDSTAAAPSFTYTANGTYTAKLTVTDTLGATNSATVTIQVGNDAPTAVIDTPAAGTTWVTGQQITFSGHGTDPQDGNLSGSSLSWSLTMEHCATIDSCHTHPLQTGTGSSGSFIAPDHEYPSYLELALTVTDSAGLTNTVVRRLDPQTVDLTFTSTPSGLNLTVGGTTQVTPFTRTVIKGSTLTVSAPTPQTNLGVKYSFQSWSDASGNTHVIEAPDTPATYTATFTGVPVACSDAFGYFCTESTASWSGATTLRNLSGDDAYESVALPFAMPFYGSTYTTAWIDTNGVLSFGTQPQGPSWNHGAIPSAPAWNTPNAAVYPLWDDLIVDSSSGVYTSTSGSAPHRQFTVEWRNVRFYSDSATRVSFKVVLNEDGKITLAYTGIGASTIEEGSTATIGIENAAGTVALQYSLNQAKLIDGRTITFTPPGAPPETSTGTVTGVVSYNGVGVPGAIVSLTNTAYSATTDANGRYTIVAAPGGYAITATAAGGRCAGLTGSGSAAVVAGTTTTTNLALAASPGTGYSCAEGDFSFISGTTASTLTGDDAYQSVTLPFAMPFYGSTYSTAWIDTNGVLSFGAQPQGPSWNHGVIPSVAAPNTPNNAVYPFWDDLIADGSSKILTTSITDGFVIEWRNMALFSTPGARVTFEVVLYKSGKITVAYKDLDAGVPAERGQTATVGVENGTGSAALQYCHNEAVLTSGRGITFTPAA